MLGKHEVCPKDKNDALRSEHGEDEGNHSEESLKTLVSECPYHDDSLFL